MQKILKGIVSNNIAVTAIFKEEHDGTYSADCPEIPGCVVTGRNKRDVTRKIKAAVQACLTNLLNDGRLKIRSSTFRAAGRS